MGENVTIAADELRLLVSEVFQKRGMASTDANCVAQSLVWADLCGHGSHGVSRAARYVEFIRRGDLNVGGRPETTIDVGSLFRIEAHRAAGAVAMDQAVQSACKKAEAFGVALGLVAHGTHIGAAGYYAHSIAERGKVGVVLGAGVPLMAYHGTAVAAVSTAPVTIAAPAGRHMSLVLDMASSVVALGKIRNAIREGRTIPEGWALTADGRPATDPSTAKVQSPLGGPKGAGLALMIEAMTSLLAGAPILSAALTAGARSPHTQNALVLAVEISFFRPLDQFQKDVDDLIDAIKGLPKAEGFQSILMPGERSQALLRRRRAEGVSLSAQLIDEIRALAADPR